MFLQYVQVNYYQNRIIHHFHYEKYLVVIKPMHLISFWLH